MLRRRNYEEDNGQGRRDKKDRGKEGRWVLITELEKIADKKEILERGGKMGWKWGCMST